MRAYPPPTTNYSSYTATSGQCVFASGAYIRIKIVPYDGRTWDYDPGFEGGQGGNQSFSFAGDGYSVDVTMDNSNGYKQTTTMKFDNYFMYGIDYMGEPGYEMPPCGPGAENDLCKEKSNSAETCCARVSSDLLVEGEQSFYRCMNRMLVDASFAIEIDGMKMSMACTGDDKKESAATYVTGAALLASGVALLASSVF